MKHRPKLAVLPPSQVVDFNALYGQNCAGCHGVVGKGGAAVALANPVFLAIADDTLIRRIASNGVPGTPMPAFAQSAGGMLGKADRCSCARNSILGEAQCAPR